MTNSRSLYYYNEEVAVADVRKLVLAWKITAAKTVVPMPANNAALVTFDALSTQAQIDNHLGTTNEFLLVAFDSTAMGADAFGGVINMGGQCGKLHYVKALCHTGTELLTTVQRMALPTSVLTASTLATECALGGEGNIGFRVNFGNTPDLDALTAGIIEIEFCYQAV